VVRPYLKKMMDKGENRISFNVFDELGKWVRGKHSHEERTIEEGS